MLKAARISFTTKKKNIFVFGLINCALYIVFLFAFKYLNLLHIWGIRMTDYVILTLLSLYQIHRFIKQKGGYIPFLETFFIILFTGTWSFVLFGAFIFAYSFSDPYITDLYVMNAPDQSRLFPAILMIFEGSGVSIIVALIAMLYSSRYEDGEVSL